MGPIAGSRPGVEMGDSLGRAMARQRPPAGRQTRGISCLAAGDSLQALLEVFRGHELLAALNDPQPYGLRSFTEIGLTQSVGEFPGPREFRDL
jgi:hypothetical protein